MSDTQTTKKVLAVRVSEETLERLRTRADEDGRSMGRYVEQLIKRDLERNAKKTE